MEIVIPQPTTIPTPADGGTTLLASVISHYRSAAVRARQKASALRALKPEPGQPKPSRVGLTRLNSEAQEADAVAAELTAKMGAVGAGAPPASHPFTFNFDARQRNVLAHALRRQIHSNRNLLRHYRRYEDVALGEEDRKNAERIYAEVCDSNALLLQIRPEPFLRIEIDEFHRDGEKLHAFVQDWLATMDRDARFTDETVFRHPAADARGNIWIYTLPNILLADAFFAAASKKGWYPRYVIR